MATINPYLNFNGNTEEAFNFYKSAFGGEFITLQRFANTPGSDEMSSEERKKILHIALPIGGNVLMGSDTTSMGNRFSAGNNFSISISAESQEEAEKLFQKLSVGGEVIMPLGDAFWGALFGILTDKFGVQWMVNYEYNEEK
jgi:PhnB protein